MFFEVFEFPLIPLLIKEAIMKKTKINSKTFMFPLIPLLIKEAMLEEFLV